MKKWIKIKDVQGYEYIINIDNISAIGLDNIILNGNTYEGDGLIRISHGQMEKLKKALMITEDDE